MRSQLLAAGYRLWPGARHVVMALAVTGAADADT
jgi:hypothetical protein